MYDLALTVSACLRADTRVDVAWAIETNGFGSRGWAGAVALTPGGGRVGSLLSGSLDAQLADLAARRSSGGWFVELSVTDLEASVTGLSCGGQARCLVVPASELPADLWDRLAAREAVCLVTHIDGDQVLETTLLTAATIDAAGEDMVQMFGRGVTDTAITDDTVLTVLWPVPSIVLVGGGPNVEALQEAAALLGWNVRVVADVATATGLVPGLAPLDNLVVASHDLDVAGPVLAAALESEVGYIGALGSRRTQQARADWLAYRGFTDLERLHGPAGLDIGATTPPEIAVSILAEALATRTAAVQASRGENSGPPTVG